MTTVYSKMKIDEILENLKKDLNEERYFHSIGTAEMAKNLAEKFGENPEKDWAGRTKI